MLIFPRKKEDLLEGHRTGRLFGHHTHMRIASMAAFLARHSDEESRRYGQYSPTQFLESMIGCMQTVRLGVSKVATPKLWRIDELLHEPNIQAFSKTKYRLRRPKVVINASINMRGGLQLLWHPNPKDFVAEDLPFHPSYSGRPLNEFLYFQEFSTYARQMHNEYMAPWERAMVGHLIFTFQGILEEIMKEVNDYCEVRVAARLAVIRDGDGRITDWEIVDQPELDARKRAEARRNKELELERVNRSLDRTLHENRIPYSELLGRVDELREAKMTYAKIEEHLVQTGRMLPLKKGEALQGLVKDLRRLVIQKAAIQEELDGMSL